jgi:hypothetical protein
MPRVWIRIHWLPSKLREFSVLWALGSMLGATQSIDMITSSRKSYGRVEVAVLNVDLLPNMINTMVIGDKANDSAKPSESRDSERKSNASMGQSSGSGQKLIRQVMQGMAMALLSKMQELFLVRLLSGFSTEVSSQVSKGLSIRTC